MVGRLGGLSNAYQDEGVWEPPRLETFTEPQYRDALQTFLSDVSFELSALIEQRPPSEKKGHLFGMYGDSAYDDMLDMLDSRDC